MWKKVKLLGVAFVIGTSGFVSLMSTEKTPTVQAASNYSETGVYPGVSSASTTRVHANKNYTIHVTQSAHQTVKVSVFRYGKLSHTKYVTGNRTISYNGSGDYSVRVYNNSRNSLRAGISITAH